VTSGLKTENSDTTGKRGRQRGYSDNPVGSRILSALSGRTRKWLAGESGISESSISDYVANGVAKADAAVAIAGALGVSVDWLLTGGPGSEGQLQQPSGSGERPAGRMSDVGTAYRPMPADEADWVEIHEFDLREIGDMEKGERLGAMPFRRDWLNRTFRRAADLWIAGLPCDYPPLDLEEGDSVICMDIDIGALRERHLCIWREDESSRLVVGRFSTVRFESIYIDDAGEYWIGRSALGGKDVPPAIVPVGRILGRPLAPIR
jgi:hypothetical protein